MTFLEFIIYLIVICTVLSLACCAIVITAAYANYSYMLFIENKKTAVSPKESLKYNTLKNIKIGQS